MPLMGEKAIDIVDIKEYVGIILKRKWLVIACFIVCLGTMTVILMLQQPTYTAVAKIQTMPGMDIDSPIRLAESQARASLPNALDNLRSEELINRTLAAVIQERNMPPNAGSAAEVRSRFIKNMSAAAAKGGSTVIILSVESLDKGFARDFVNRWADEFIAFKTKQIAEELERATEKVKVTIASLKKEMDEAEKAMRDYRIDQKLHTIDDANLLDEKRLMELYSQRDRLRNQLIEMEIRERLWVNDPDAIFGGVFIKEGVEEKGDDKANEQQPKPAAQVQRGFTPSVANEAYYNYKKQKGLLQERRDLLLQELYKERHPAVRELTREIEAVDALIKQELLVAQQRFQTEMAITRAQRAQVDKEISEVEVRVADTQRKLKTFAELESKYNKLREEYNGRVNRVREVEMRFAQSREPFRIQERANTPESASGPRYRTGLLLSAAFGLGIGIVLAFFIEYVDDSIKVAEEVERDLKLPFLGMVPSAHWQADDLKAHLLHNLSQQSGIAEAYRMVRSAVLFAAPKDKLKVLLMTSAVPLEGKTTSSLNLSIGFAQANERVLLIDCDLRRGELHRYFDLPKTPGMSDFLKGEKQPEELIKHTEVPNLDIISTGEYPTNPAELLLSPRMKEIIDWARGKYDRIFIDAPPAMGISDAAILSSIVDGLLLVVWAGHTSRRFVRAAKDSLLARGANLVGFMLNNLDIGRVGYYYYYPYYYSYYYTYQAYGKDGKPKPPQPGGGASPQDQPEDVY
jgi:capsular exopolysaccharide synthesis family protein